MMNGRKGEETMILKRPGNTLTPHHHGISILVITSPNSLHLQQCMQNVASKNNQS
jgi:hypothetical protein